MCMNKQSKPRSRSYHGLDKGVGLDAPSFPLHHKLHKYVSTFINGGAVGP